MYRRYNDDYYFLDVYELPLDDDRFNIFLSKFLLSPRNARYQANFIFENELECGAPAPRIKVNKNEILIRILMNMIIIQKSFKNL